MDYMKLLQNIRDNAQQAAEAKRRLMAAKSVQRGNRRMEAAVYALSGRIRAGSRNGAGDHPQREGSRGHAAFVSAQGEEHALVGGVSRAVQRAVGDRRVAGGQPLPAGKLSELDGVQGLSLRRRGRRIAFRLRKSWESGRDVRAARRMPAAFFMSKKRRRCACIPTAADSTASAATRMATRSRCTRRRFPCRRWRPRSASARTLALSTTGAGNAVLVCRAKRLR